MTDPDVLRLLAEHRTLGAAPAAELAWLAAHGTVRRLNVGDVMVRGGELATHLTIIFTGSVVIRADRGAGSRKVYEVGDGDVTGTLPYSRGARPPTDAVAEEPTEVLQIPNASVLEMARECPVVTATLVHVMIDRTKHFSAGELRDEKMLSLGRLSAGLSHELNNPASAAVRSAKRLAESLGAADTAAAALGASGVTEAQFAAIQRLRDLCAEPSSGSTLSVLARADREDDIRDWLERHGADERCAEALAETSVTIAALDEVRDAVPAAALTAALRWVSAGCVVRTIASEIETAASRIHEIVESVKRFTFMDHASTAEPVDIRRGINDTFTMLGSKVRAKSAEVSVEFAENLPRAHAEGGELNQVWMNLIDNALDAIAPGGQVRVSAQYERQRVVVRIQDDGTGIPEAVIGRIFDPFFTTKGIGEGTGMGLDIVRRIVRRQAGEIEVESRPGQTVFLVRLPVERRGSGHIARVDIASKS